MADSPVTQRPGSSKSSKPISTRFVDRVGQRFGLLTVVGRAPGSKTIWLCNCDCGTQEHPVSNGNIKATRSCGCLSNKLIDLTGAKKAVPFIARTAVPLGVAAASGYVGYKYYQATKGEPHDRPQRPTPCSRC
jgi:hypothetical protein